MRKNAMKIFLTTLFMLIFILSSVNLDVVQAGSVSQSSNWWNTDWHFRFQVRVDSGQFTRDDDHIELHMDFPSIFSTWGISGTLDPDSIRVIDHSEFPNEVLSQYDASTEEIIWLTGYMDANTSKTYFVYFDTLENGPKAYPDYYKSTENGGVSVLNPGDDISVMSKIAGIEHETARINLLNGKLCYLKPPYGNAILDRQGSTLGFMSKEGDSSQNQKEKDALTRARIVSITGGPLRYKIEFKQEYFQFDDLIFSNDYCYIFYYVSNGNEVRIKFKNERTVFESFVPKTPREKWPTSFGIKGAKSKSFHTAFFAIGIDSAALYDISNTWNSQDIDSGVPAALSDNFCGVFGENGGLGIIPVNPSHTDLEVDWSIKGDYREWSVKNKSLIEFITLGTYYWDFWIHGYDTQGWDQAKDFAKRIKEPAAAEVHFDQFFSRENHYNNYTNYDLGRELYRFYPEEEKIEVAWVGNGWRYRKSHTIRGSKNGTQFDYPMPLIVHYASGIDTKDHVYLETKCRRDFGDVRFTTKDGSTPLNYWIEKITDGGEATFWIDVDSIPLHPETTTIYIYYGKDNATTTSNGKKTFDWFDDFESDSSNDYDIGRHARQWQGFNVYKPYYDSVNKRVAYDAGDNFTGGWMVRKNKLNIQNFAAKATFGVTDFYPYNTTNGIIGRWSARDSFYGLCIAGGYYSHSPAIVKNNRGNCISTPPDNTYHPFDGIPHTLELKIYESSLTGIYNEGEADEVVLKGANEQYEEAGQVGIIVAQAIGWFDVFFVRKYVEPEPSHGAWKDEEEVPVYPPIGVSLERKVNRSLFKKEAFHTISWSLNPKNSYLSITHYQIYRKDMIASDGGYQLIATVPADTFTYLDGNLDASKKFLYVLTSLESGGQESKKSAFVGN